ncbi:MAG: enoyl-CoA hydratase/isomerase family protein [Betaproteobacteria bacterium]|nr:enoyl-CoA hydratase/isomerase family protein [Betaproteobacteria bacterium]
MTRPALKDSALAVEDRVAVLTFKRDDVRNALTSTELVNDIPAVIDWANASPEISALILTGEGSAFSAGGNIKTMGERAKAAPHILEQNYRAGVQRIPLALERAQIPVIAAVNGPAIGAGFDMANMCDIRVGSTNAQFGETFANLGIIAGDGGGWFLIRLLGYQRAAELTFTGRIVKAEEALKLGILLELTEPGELLPRAKALAATIAGKPPQAIRYAKRLLKLAQRQGLDEHLDVCSAFQAICHKTEDHQEALAAFFEKRTGRFKGA